MNDQEKRAFQLIFEFYAKWRDQIIETDDQWSAFAEDVGKYVREAGCDSCRIAWHLLEAVLETFNDLYKGGMMPMPANYFGRDDLST